MAAATKGKIARTEFYAHALAIEREAARRYWEFAHQLLLYRKNIIAGVLLELARRECEQLDALEYETAGMALPALAPSEHRWHGVDGQDDGPLFIARCLSNPAHALEVALENERRAKAFYERMAVTLSDLEARRIATKHASDENEHIAFIERALRQNIAMDKARSDTRAAAMPA
ncbi:MAG TPA: hypothetical protein VFG44_07875 [Burkholderiales bacterium]|jgi:rubrerythrin|nr:hypothetical protein [Burkholderiales bacterium]